jgi:hypothetical protein
VALLEIKLLHGEPISLDALPAFFLGAFSKRKKVNFFHAD